MIPEKVATLLAPVDGDVLSRVSEAWRWLLNDDYDLLGVTVIGDLLCTNTLNEVYRVDSIEGSLTQVASDIGALEHLAHSTEVRDNIFLEGLALAATKDAPLPLNHCVGFTVPPILGGPTDVSNVRIASVEVYQVWTGRLHEALRRVPPGHQVLGVDVDESGQVAVRWR